MSAETSQTLARGLRVLELLAEYPRGISVAQVASEQPGEDYTASWNISS